MKDRQFTGRNSEGKIVGGVSHSVVRMRHRSYHFCKPCLELDPAGQATHGLGKCKYEELCGPADNVVQVPKAKVRGTAATRTGAAAAMRLEIGREAAEGDVVVCFLKPEPEAWLLGRVIKKAFMPNCKFKDRRGEVVKEGVEHLGV